MNYKNRGKTNKYVSKSQKYRYLLKLMNIKDIAI